MPQQVTFTTSDGVDIAADYYADGEEKFVILLPMMPATKESWNVFAELLLETGYNALAVDLRGHGQSTMQGQLDYKIFSDKQHQQSIHDVEAALRFLKDRGCEEENVVLVGASIGANLAIQCLEKHPKIPAAVAISPGIDYHGVVSDVPLEKLESHQRVFLLTSTEDDYSCESVEELEELSPRQVTVKVEVGEGHGTDLFMKNPALMDEIIEWLDS